MKTKFITTLAALLLTSTALLGTAHAQGAPMQPSSYNPATPDTSNAILLTEGDAYENGGGIISIPQGKVIIFYTGVPSPQAFSPGNINATQMPTNGWGNTLFWENSMPPEWSFQQDNENLSYFKEEDVEYPITNSTIVVVPYDFFFKAMSLGETTLTFTCVENPESSTPSSTSASPAQPKTLTFHINVVADDSSTTPAATPATTATPDSSSVSSDGSNPNDTTMYGCSDSSDKHCKKNDSTLGSSNSSNDNDNPAEDGE